MCIAILKRGDAEPLSDEVLRTCYINNKDSCGFSGTNIDDLGRRKLIIYKSMTFEPFLHKLRRFEANNPTAPIMIHFRIATSGELSTFNAHPFSFQGDHCRVKHILDAGTQPSFLLSGELAICSTSSP